MFKEVEFQFEADEIPALFDDNRDDKMIDDGR